ncbi:D-alanyl-D-alanine carboxypeptidase family protein [Paenibacillaceae bacterium]|nr:D-alanyl-D-alanine carboxypeptidase family protein [Paenibacillaceae bacterium]
MILQLEEGAASVNRLKQTIVLIFIFAIVSACGIAQENEGSTGGSTIEESPVKVEDQDKAGNPEETDQGGTNPTDEAETDVKLTTVKDETAIAVLVNKGNKLPDNYVPNDLVYPDVLFTFKEKIEKRMMRREAAAALETLFAQATSDGVPLAGVSAYRSESRQKELFAFYVKRDGEEKARTYSAFPGTSEHQTGLSIDVTGSDGKCSVEDCFGDTPEAEWLAKHAHEFGFIIRYPQGKDDITGYKYEPWHLRYVGLETAADIYQQDITLEEYLNDFKAN